MRNSDTHAFHENSYLQYFSLKSHFKWPHQLSCELLTELFENAAAASVLPIDDKIIRARLRTQ